MHAWLSPQGGGARWSRHSFRIHHTKYFHHLRYFHHLKYSQVSTTIVTPSECYRFTLYIFSTFPSLERGFKIVWYFALGLNKSRHICSFINSTFLAFLSLSCNLQVNWLRGILLMYNIQFTPAGVFFGGSASRCTELLCERVCK